MSDRERWIVYPMILFAFLLAARDKYAKPDQATFRTLRCQELRVVSESGKSLIDLYGSLEDAGVMVVYSHGQGGEPGDVPHLDPLSDETTLGRPVVEMGADGHLGFVQVYGHDAEINLKLGHQRTNQFSGLYGLNSDDELLRQDAATWGLIRDWERSAELSTEPSEPEPDESPEKSEPVAE